MREIVSPLSGIRSPFGQRRDLYKVLGFKPGLVADFGAEYYRATGRTTFANAITHAATTNATMVDSDGLLKWRPHNLLTYSEDFTNAAWGKTSVTVSAAAATAPNGSTTADLVELVGAAGNNQTIFTFYTISANMTYGLWVKAITTADVGKTIRLDSTGGGAVAKTVSLTADWQFVFISPSPNGYAQYRLISVPGSTATQFYLWGAHLYRSDLGGMVNNPDTGDSYVPTTSAAVYLPRRNHHVWNGSAWVNEGLLHESEARTNLTTYSNDFSQAYWSDQNATRATTTDDFTTITPTGASSAIRFSGNEAVSGSTSYVFTADFRQNGADFGFVQLNSNGGTLRATSTYIDFSDGSITVLSEAGGGYSAQEGFVEQVGSGIYRVSLVVTTDADHTGLKGYIGAATAVGTKTSSGADTIDVRYSQFEEGSTPSSYIPTNGSTATRAAETLTIPAATLIDAGIIKQGPEAVTNGTFDTDSDWTKGTNATISGGLLTYAGGSGNTDTFQPLSNGTIESGKVVKVTYTISGRTGGSATVRLGATSGTARSADGTYTDYLVSPGSGTLYADISSNFVGSIDNISVKELSMPGEVVIGDELVTNGTFDTDSDWTKGTGWTISGVATATSATSGLYQALSLVAGNTYRVTYTVSGFSAGSVRPRFIGGTVASGAPVAANGTHTDYLVATSGTLGLDITGSIFTGTIDNISVTEIDPLAVSIQMEGRMNYADTVASTDAQFLLWQADSNNKINNYLISNGATTGQIVFLQRDAGTSDFTASPATTYSPGILVPFNIASRHGSTFVNGAVDGTALTADTTPVALPDLSATDLDLGYDFMGTIKTFRMWAADLGDTGIAEASS